MKTFVFAIDGATWDIIDPLVESGAMPHMASLMKKGTRARLQTLTPTESPQIWTSIATGTVPEKHGINSFTVKIPGTEKTTLPGSNLRKKKAFWNILSDSGCSMGIVGWWCTYPAEEVNGFIISDRANYYKKKTLHHCLDLTDEKLKSREPKETYPDSLYDEIEPYVRYSFEFDDSRLERFVDLNDEDRKRLKSCSTLTRDECLSVLKYVHIYDESFRSSALYALKKFKPDLFTVFLAGVDGVEHHFWKYMQPEKFKSVPADLVDRYGKAIPNYYKYLDETLGEFLKFCSDDSRVIILSDHGHEATPHFGTDQAEGYGRIACGTHEHGPDGIFLISGPGIKENSEIAEASVLDFAPTLLAMHGKPVAEDMDGRVLLELFKDGFFDERPITTVESYSSDIADDIVPVESRMDEAYKNKLRALGYIE